MRARYSRRGFSLLEVLIALAVITAAGLGTLQLLDVLSRSNSNVAGQSEALALARTLRSEIENQDMLLGQIVADPRWAAGLHAAPMPGVFDTVGDITAGPFANKYRVTWELTRWQPDVDGDGAPDNTPPENGVRGADIVIRVDNIIGPPTNGLDSRAKLLRPVILSFRKEAQASIAVTTGGVLRW